MNITESCHRLGTDIDVVLVRTARWESGPAHGQDNVMKEYTLAIDGVAYPLAVVRNGWDNSNGNHYAGAYDNLAVLTRSAGPGRVTAQSGIKCARLLMVKMRRAGVLHIAPFEVMPTD
jgi:hypothetical protein